MRILVATDLEGVAGVLLDAQVSGGSSEYQTARHLLTQEVNAVVEGALAGGADEVIVDDGHHTGFNLIYDEVHPQAQCVMGRPRPAWLAEMSEDVGATFFIGCHAMAGTQGAVRDHTMSSATWHNMWLNGKLAGEIGLWAAVAGHYGVPCVLASGCQKACQEANALMPGIETVVTKMGLSRYAAVLSPVEGVRRSLRERARVAVAKTDSVAPYRLDAPVEIRVEYSLTAHADQVSMLPGRERIDARTVSYRAGNILDAMRLL